MLDPGKEAGGNNRYFDVTHTYIIFWQGRNLPLPVRRLIGTVQSDWLVAS